MFEIVICLRLESSRGSGGHWKHCRSSTLTVEMVLECSVVIIASGMIKLDSGALAATLSSPYEMYDVVGVSHQKRIR